MSHRVIVQSDPSSPGTVIYSPEMLRHIGMHVEALLSRYSSLKMHKRAIERQLAAMAARICEQDGVLLPRSVFLLLEMRGSGGVSAQLEHIARIVDEQGYWKPREHVPNYHRQDVYRLGQSAQRLFDDYTALDHCIEQVQAHLRHIRQCRQMGADATPQEVFEELAASADLVSVQNGVDAIVQLLWPAMQPRWFRWFFVHRGRKTKGKNSWCQQSQAS
jgi:hypothetical protein